MVLDAAKSDAKPCRVRCLVTTCFLFEDGHLLFVPSDKSRELLTMTLLYEHAKPDGCGGACL